MAKKMDMTDNEIKYIVEQEIQNTQGTSGDDISNERAKALDYYNGEMEEYLSTEEDRTNVVSRDVLDTVESVLPSLLKVFYDPENLITFDPHGAEDEPAAKQETAVVEHIFFEQNDGFTNLYTFCKDALTSKNGVLKALWVEDEWQREEYNDLTPPELDALLSDNSREIEIEEYEVTEDQLIDIEISTRRRAGHIEILPTPPEEFGISRNATSVNPGDAGFCFHRVRKTVGELIEQGYDRDKVESIPHDDDNADTDEQLARYKHTDEQLTGGGMNPVTRTVWVTEAYIILDLKDDGIGSLHKVTLAGNSSNFNASAAVLLDKEEVDSVPFFSATPVMRTHAFSGMSLADLVMDLQEIRTILLRSIVDNTLQANNVRSAANDNVVLGDLLTSRPGGVVRVKGKQPPSQSLMPLPSAQLPQQAYALMELLEDTIKQRTGVGDEVQGLDTSALSNVNTGVIMAALEQSRMRIELMAQIIAETGLKPLFRHIHALSKKHSTKEIAIKLEGQWTPINPNTWRERTDLTVEIGVGKDSKAKKLAMLGQTYQQQMALMQAGVPLVQPQNLYATLAEQSKHMGIDPRMAWTHPNDVPQPPPPGPDPQMMMLQAQQQHQQAQLAFDQQKHQDDMMLKVQEQQNSLEVAAQKADADIQKNVIQLEKTKVDEQSEIMGANANNQRDIMTAQHNEEKLAWQQQVDTMKLEMDKYKADLSALTSLVKEAASTQTLTYLESEVNEAE